MSNGNAGGSLPAPAEIDGSLVQSDLTRMRAEAPVSRRGYAAIAMAATLWGSWSLFFRPAERLASISPAVQCFMVYALGIVVVAPLAWRARRRVRRPLTAWAMMAAVGVIDVLNVLFFFYAMQGASLAVAVLTHYLSVPLVAIAAPLFLGERPGRSAWLTLGLALVGLVLLLEPWQSASMKMLGGAAFGGVSAVFFALNVLISKRATRHFAWLEVQAWRTPSALLVLLLFVPAGGFLLPGAVYALLGGAALLGGLVAGLLYYWGLARIPAAHVTLLGLLEPLVAVGIGIVVWHEIPGPAAALGALLILAALYAATRVVRPQPAVGG